MRKVLISDRSLYSEIGRDLETLKNYLRLLPLLREVSAEDRALIKSYPNLNLTEAENLNSYCDNIASIKMPVFGYLFAGKQLLSIGEMIEKITGISGLLPDPYFAESGFHQIQNHGYLNIHADFSHHDYLGLERRINLLYYLNDNWKI